MTDPDPLLSKWLIEGAALTLRGGRSACLEIRIGDDGGLWGHGLRFPGTHRNPPPMTDDARIAARGLPRLGYYNGATHGAMLARPNFLRALLP